jgi:hypothetical protein
MYGGVIFIRHSREGDYVVIDGTVFTAVMSCRAEIRCFFEFRHSLEVGIYRTLSWGQALRGSDNHLQPIYKTQR